MVVQALSVILVLAVVMSVIALGAGEPRTDP